MRSAACPRVRFEEVFTFVLALAAPSTTLISFSASVIVIGSFGRKLVFALLIQPASTA